MSLRQKAQPETQGGDPNDASCCGHRSCPSLIKRVRQTSMQRRLHARAAPVHGVAPITPTCTTHVTGECARARAHAKRAMTQMARSSLAPKTKTSETLWYGDEHAPFTNHASYCYDTPGTRTRACPDEASGSRRASRTPASRLSHSCLACNKNSRARWPKNRVASAAGASTYNDAVAALHHARCCMAK